MSDRYNDEFAALLTPPPSTGVQFTQARVLTWNNETLANTLEWRGVTITDVPLVEGINALTIQPDDIVGMLGWAPENAKGVGSWWILGKLSNPGEFVGDLTVTTRVFRLILDNGNLLAFMGRDAAGNPRWRFTYGDIAGTTAFGLIDANRVSLFDVNSNEVMGTDSFTGVGLARPWIPYLMNPTHDAEISGPTYTPATTSASFATIWRGFNPVFHPAVSYGVSTFGTGTTEWRIRVDPGTGLTTVASGSGSATDRFNIPTWGTTANPGDVLEFIVQARNTSGGTSHITVDRFYGRQS